MPDALIKNLTNIYFISDLLAWRTGVRKQGGVWTHNLFREGFEIMNERL